MIGVSPVYRTRTIKRDRRTAARVEQLDRQILDVLREDHSQSTRHCFYRLTDPRLPEPVEKSDRGYRHVQDRIVKLRRAGQFLTIGSATPPAAATTFRPIPARRIFCAA